MSHFAIQVLESIQSAPHLFDFRGRVADGPAQLLYSENAISKYHSSRSSRSVVLIVFLSRSENMLITLCWTICACLCNTVIRIESAKRLYRKLSHSAARKFASPVWYLCLSDGDIDDPSCIRSTPKHECSQNIISCTTARNKLNAPCRVGFPACSSGKRTMRATRHVIASSRIPFGRHPLSSKHLRPRVAPFAAGTLSKNSSIQAEFW